MEKISEFIKGNGNKIIVGKYEIRELKDGSYFIEHESGEGTQVSKYCFEVCINKFYVDNF